MRKRLLIILSILLLNTFVFSEYPDQEEYQAQYYDNARVLRVKYAQGETYVQRSYDEGFEEATVNLSIFEKDKVGTTEGRVEIYLGRLNFLRLDYDTEVEFERAPELRKTDMTLRIRRGGIYLDIQNLDNERDVEIQTPDCGVFLLNKGVYRLNVTEGGETEVLVYEGLVEVSGDDYSRNVRENQKIIMRNGRVTERPFYFYAANTDDFDRWNHGRNSAGGYARYGVSRYLSHGYEDYEYELSRNGRWVYNNSCREYTWIPYNIGTNWRPYYHGRWNWNPFYGYVWTSYDSWGYFTHHYGRWEWDSYYGWYWLPGYHWSPAWVYWFWDNDYYGWCPVSRWNRPVIIINNHWNRNHDYHRNGIPVHSRSTVIIKKHQLSAAHIDRVAVNKTTLREANIKAKGFGPKERPALETVRVVNARGKTVVYKKSGFQETQNYQTVKPGQGIAKAAKDSDYMYRDSGSKSTENKAFKYSKGSKPENTESPRTFGREVKIEKKEAPGSASSGKSYKSDSLDNSEKSNEKSSAGSERTFGREVKIEKKETPSGASSGKSSEKSSAGSNDREKSRPVEVSKTKYKPSDPKKTGTSDALGRGSSSGTAHKVKEKEKDSPGFSPSERYYPSSKPSTSDNSSSYRSSTRNNSYQDSALKKQSAKSSSETYVPSYRSKYPSLSEKLYSSENSSPREKVSYSSYKSYAKPESSSGSSRSYSSTASSSSRYSSPSRSYSSQSSSSYSGSSSSHSSYSAPSSSHSSYSAPSSSHSSHSASSSSGSHNGTAVKKRD